MSFANDAESYMPNADILRLREYAKVLSGVSDIIESIEEPGTKLDTTEYSYSLGVSGDGEYAIPSIVCEHIGQVEKIDVLLRHTTDIVTDGQAEHPYYEIEPTEEAVLDALLRTLPDQPSADTTLAEAVSISIYFHGANAVYALSRSSLEEAHTTPDAILKKVNNTMVDSPVPAMAQADFNHLILSIVAPQSHATERSDSHYEEADFLNPAAFGVLHELFEGVTFTDEDYQGHQFQTSDTFFKYYHHFDPTDEQPMTSFRIQFTSNETGNQIFVRSDLDTHFELSFETMTESDPEAPLVTPYTPTLSELQHLAELLKTENQTLRTGVQTDAVSFDTGFDTIAPIDAIALATDAIQEEQEFKRIEDTEIEAAYFDIIERLNEEPDEKN